MFNHTSLTKFYDWEHLNHLVKTKALNFSSYIDPLRTDAEDTFHLEPPLSKDRSDRHGRRKSGWNGNSNDVQHIQDDNPCIVLQSENQNKLCHTVTVPMKPSQRWKNQNARNQLMGSASDLTTRPHSLTSAKDGTMTWQSPLRMGIYLATSRRNFTGCQCTNTWSLRT